MSVKAHHPPSGPVVVVAVPSSVTALSLHNILGEGGRREHSERRRESRRHPPSQLSAADSASIVEALVILPHYLRLTPSAPVEVAADPRL